MYYTGIKKRDKVQNRLGRLNARFPAVSKNYNISFEYDSKGITTSMTWKRKAEADMQAVLAYWVVSTTKNRLKQSGINVRWEELLRIMSAQQRVTMVAEQANGHILKVRRSSIPEEKLANIHKALGITSQPVCSIKSV